MKNLLFFRTLLLLTLAVGGCQKSSIEELQVIGNVELQSVSTERASCVSETALNVGQAATDNSIELTEAGTSTNWRTFENYVCTLLPTAYAKAPQVSLDVVVSGTTYRIIADYLVKEGNVYRVVDAKASATVNLAALASMSTKCTANQKIVYPYLNGASRAAKIAGTMGQPLALNAGANIMLAKGVDFYVNTPAGQYSSGYTKRAY